MDGGLLSDLIASDPQLSALQDSDEKEDLHFRLLVVKDEVSSWDAVLAATSLRGSQRPPDTLVISDDLLVTTDPLTLLEVH